LDIVDDKYIPQENRIRSGKYIEILAMSCRTTSCSTCKTRQKLISSVVILKSLTSTGKLKVGFFLTN
jgi:hypothetical protein